MKKFIITSLFVLLLAPTSFAYSQKTCDLKPQRYKHDHRYGFYEPIVYAHPNHCGYNCKKRKLRKWRKWHRRNYRKCKNHYEYHDHDDYEYYESKKHKKRRKHRAHKEHRYDRHDGDYGHVSFGHHDNDGYFRISVGTVY